MPEGTSSFEECSELNKKIDIEAAFDSAKSEEDYAAVAEAAKSSFDNRADLYDFRGRFFLDVNNPYFDPSEAEESFLIAAMEGHPSSPWHLARHYKSGMFGPPSADRYHSFLKLTNPNHPGAHSTRIAQTLNRWEADKYGLDEEETTLLKSAFDHPLASFPTAAVLSDAYIHGRFVEQNYGRAFEICSELGNKKLQVPPCLYGAVQAAIMAIFEIGTSNRSAAIDLIAWIEFPPRKNRLHATVSHYLGLIRKTVKFETAADPALTEQARRVARNLFIHGTTENRSQGSSETVLWYVNLIKVLSRLASHHHFEPIQSFLRSSQLVALNLDDDELARSTLDEGVKLNSVKGFLPIVGKREIPAEPGFSYIDGASLFQNDLTINGTVDETVGPLIFSDDVATCLAFAYGFREAVVWPSLSIEPIEHRSSKNIDWLVRRKVFYPPGFGRTRMGKTFFRTDWMLPKFLSALNPKFIGENNPDIDPGLRELSAAVFKEMQFAGGVPVGRSTRVMLRPVDMKVVSRKESDCTTFSVLSGRIFVDGAGVIDHEDGTSDRGIHQNDVRTDGGRTAYKITESMNAIRVLIPAYERLLQLYRLMAVLGHMREEGVELPRHIAEQAATRAQTLASCKETAEYCV